MMQLATEANGQPWVCNVWFAADDKFNFYWFSANNRRHSKEVRKNPKVAAAICLLQSPADQPRGLQLEGLAEELNSDEEIAQARDVYQDRIFDAKTIDNFMAHKERPHKFYKIKPTLFVLFDAVNFPDNPRQEWKPK